MEERRARPYKIFDRPFVLFMGPQRSGTSWLDRYLRVRGDVCLPSDVKEVFFFDRDFDKGIQSYTAHFSPQDTHQKIMEISTTSFDHPNAPKRVFDVFGKNIQLICPLRHPIVRSYSLYLHYLRYGIVTGSLQDACQQLPQILTSSHYTENLKRWMTYYNLEEISFVFQETLEADQNLFLNELCTILDLPHIEPPEELRERFNVTTYSKSGMIAGLAQKLADWLRQNRIYFIINFAKSLGLKRIIFGQENPDATRSGISEEDYDFLAKELGKETEKLEKLLGRSIKEWA